MTDMHHNKKGYGRVIPFEQPYRYRNDSQALQQIINVLKHPLQTSCDTCNGLGFIRSGQDCPTCEGSGKVLDDLFR